MQYHIFNSFIVSVVFFERQKIKLQMKTIQCDLRENDPRPRLKLKKPRSGWYAEGPLHWHSIVNDAAST